MALVQTKSQGDGYVNSFTITPSGAVTAGNFLYLSVTAGYANTVASVTDTLGNTWTSSVDSSNSEVGERKTFNYYVKNTAGGTPTITLTWGASQFADAATILREYSGIDTASPADQTSTANSGTSYVTTHSVGTTATTTQADELIILGGGSSGAASPVFVAGSGYGNGIEQKGSDLYTYGFLSDKTVSSTGTQTGDFTSTSNVRSQGFIATFKLTGGTPANTTNFFQYF